MVRLIGADHVIDYTQEDFTKTGHRYDVILDMIGNHSLSALRQALTNDGTLVLVGGPDTGRWLGPLTGLFKAVVMSWFVSQKLRPCLAQPRKEDLTLMQDLLATGKVSPVVDRIYPLTEVAAAVRYLEEGHARGKVVVTMDHRSEV